MIRLISVFLLLLFIAEAFAETPIVYSRCKRTLDTLQVTDTVMVGGSPEQASRTLTHMDVYDVLPDVTNFFDNFSMPCDLVYRDASGVETVLYDCSTTSTDLASCAALDAQVSWDATKIVFSLFKGTLRQYSDVIDYRVLNVNADSGFTGYWARPNRFLDPQDAGRGAHLLYYDFGDSQVHEITSFVAGQWDSGPTFIDANRIAFTSTRDGHRTPRLQVGGTSNGGNTHLGTRIYSIDLNGDNLRLDSHHSTSQEQHPFMLKNGWVAYSSWQIFAGLAYRYPNSVPGNFTTDQNMFFVYHQRPDGSMNFPLYGQHSCDHFPCYMGGGQTNALHFYGQTTDERIWITNYYRGNNNGAGSLIGFIQEPMEQEGKVTDIANLFVPNDAINFAAWASNSDNASTINVSTQITHPNYTDQLVFNGKLTHPTGLPSNGLMFVWAKGACNNQVGHNLAYTALSLPAPPATSGGGGFIQSNTVQSLNMDIPGCDAGIYKASVVPSAHQNDLVQIVDTEEWHEIMPRAVVPYSSIYGVSAPTAIERSDLRTSHADLPKGTPFGLLGAASIIDRETDHFDGIMYQGTFHSHAEYPFNLQGTDAINYADSDLCGVRIIGVLPNRGPNANTETLNFFGERAAILGEVPVLHYDAQDQRIFDPSGNPDTSFLIRLPANVPHQLQAIDCDGHMLNTDQTWQTVKPGEVKTCGGCHVHSRATLINFEQSYAATPSYTIPVLGEGSVQMLAGKTGNAVNTTTVSNSYGVQYDFTDDIIPILNSRCVSCHSGGSPAGMLNLDTTGQTHSDTCSVWYTLVKDVNQSCLDASKQITINATDGLNWRRQNLTKFMAAYNPLRSLLYWKAAGERKDGLTDGSRSDDVDFGTAHTTTATYAELGILQRWITMGAPGGTEEKKDTQKPTLHLAATVIDNAGTPEITQLHVGTVDLGAGIDTTTLSVTVNGGSNLVVSGGQPHGITTIVLGAPITVGTDVISATVSDLATSPNTTTETRTAEYYLSAAAALPLSVTGCGNSSLNEGSTYTCAVIVADGSPPYDYVIDWGDGQANDTGQTSLNRFDISRLIVDGPGSQTVTVTITDSDTNQVVDNMVLDIKNVISTGSVNVSGSGIAGQSYTIGYYINDPGDDSMSITVNWGDGTINNLTTHTYAEPGSYTVNFSAIDEDGVSISNTHVVTINNE